MRRGSRLPSGVAVFPLLAAAILLSAGSAIGQVRSTGRSAPLRPPEITAVEPTIVGIGSRIRIRGSGQLAFDTAPLRPFEIAVKQRSRSASEAVSAGSLV